MEYLLIMATLCLGLAGIFLKRWKFLSVGLMIITSGVSARIVWNNDIKQSQTIGKLDSLKNANSEVVDQLASIRQTSKEIQNPLLPLRMQGRVRLLYERFPADVRDQFERNIKSFLTQPASVDSRIEWSVERNYANLHKVCNDARNASCRFDKLILDWIPSTELIFYKSAAFDEDLGKRDYAILMDFSDREADFQIAYSFIEDVNGKSVQVEFEFFNPKPLEYKTDVKSLYSINEGLLFVRAFQRKENVFIYDWLEFFSGIDQATQSFASEFGVDRYRSWSTEDYIVYKIPGSDLLKWRN